MIIVNPSTRQFNVPGADLVFGVTADAGSEVKYFQCPRIVGNNLDLSGCFIRMNYRNAQGEIDSYLVKNVTVDGDNIVFGWELSPKVTMYKGNVNFVMCVVGPDTKVAWHTTLGRGQVLEGLEPDEALVEEGTADVVAALIAMVEAQTKAVADKGAEWVRNVQSEGTDQIIAVQTAGKDAKVAAVAEIEAKGVNVRESIPNDYTAVQNALDDVVRGRAGAIVCSVEGSAIAVNDASDMVIQGMKIFGRSTQNGTPTPDAPVEIKNVVEPVVTVCGDNILNCTPTTYQHYDVKFTTNADGSVTVTGTATGSAFCRLASVNLTAGTPYVLTGGTSDITLSFRNHAMGAVYSPSDVEYVPDENVTVYVAIRVGAGVTVNETIYPMVRLGAVKDTTWKPYSGQTVELPHTLPGIPVTSGGNYTDSDGQQWICDEVDLERGVYVQRILEVVYDGSGETWYKSKDDDDIYLYHISIKQAVTVGDGSCLCDKLQRRSTSEIQVAGNTLDLVGISPSPKYSVIYLNVGYYLSENTVEALTEFLSANPLTVKYILASPIETPLSETEIAAYRAMHSNYPNTTVLNDAGAHMVVKYAADTKLYIDNKIAALIGG